MAFITHAASCGLYV